MGYIKQEFKDLVKFKNFLKKYLSNLFYKAYIR